MAGRGSDRGDELGTEFIPVADHALLVQFATEMNEAANAAVGMLDRAIAHADIDGVVEVVPAFVSLLVDFDPLATDHAGIEAAVGRLLADPPDVTATPDRHTVQVCYHESFAPDLPAVAAACGVSVEAVIDAHASGSYRVVMYGFAPGCAYMSGVAGDIQVPRKPAPVRGVPAGSVIIAGPQCLITTIVMPSGWSVIGRSATQILRPDTESPFLFDPGDHVDVERIDLATFERLVAAR